MRRQPTLTKRQRRELDQVPPQRLQRPRTLTRMVAPAALPKGWRKCPHCGGALQLSALFVLHMIEPAITSTDAGEVIDNPDAGKVAVADGAAMIGHMCPMCVQPIWPGD